MIKALKTNKQTKNLRYATGHYQPPQPHKQHTHRHANKHTTKTKYVTKAKKTHPNSLYSHQLISQLIDEQNYSGKRNINWVISVYISESVKIDIYKVDSDVSQMYICVGCFSYNTLGTNLVQNMKLQSSLVRQFSQHISCSTRILMYTRQFKRATVTGKRTIVVEIWSVEFRKN